MTAAIEHALAAADWGQAGRLIDHTAIPHRPAGLPVDSLSLAGGPAEDAPGTDPLKSLVWAAFDLGRLKDSEQPLLVEQAWQERETKPG
jgi:hypothetical protein